MNLRPFEIVIIGIFGLLAFGGLAMLALFKATPDEGTGTYGSSVVIWGTQERSTMDALISSITTSDAGFSAVKYEQKDARTFDDDLLAAIASQRSPDLVIIPHHSLVAYESIVVPITYERLPLATFRETYTDGADIFLTDKGALAFPITIDPLVMYWNRDLFAGGGLPFPPQTWELLLNETIPSLTKKSDSLTLTQQAVALGSYTNIAYAKEIISMLFLQAGADIVDRNRGGYRVTLNRASEDGLPSGEAAMPFYTQFANPASQYYTWNAALPTDKEQFIGGKLALLFAPGSLYKEIARANPNLSFDITPVPQGSTATIRRTYGEYMGIAILKASRNQVGAYGVAQKISSAANVNKLVGEYALAPAHRSLLANPLPDSWSKTVYASALITRGWLDPDSRATSDIFREMIDDITSGRERVTAALATAARKIELLFK